MLAAASVIVRLLMRDDREQAAYAASLFPNVRVEDESAVTSALALSAQGIDFADALHLTSRPLGVRFASFDQGFIRRAQRAGVADVGILDSKTF